MFSYWVKQLNTNYIIFAFISFKYNLKHNLKNKIQEIKIWAIGTFNVSFIINKILENIGVLLLLVALVRIILVGL